MRQVDSFVEGVGTTDHVLLFYDTKESKREILYRYLAEGLVRGKGIVYVYTEETPESIFTGLAHQGIDVEPNLVSGNILTPRYDEFYIVNGEAEALKILNRWHELCRRFKSKGLGLRATGETSCFFRKGKVRELLRYEYILKRVLRLPMDAICAYNLRTIVETGYTDMIMPLVRAHGKAIFASEGGNMILEPKRIEDTDIERLLDIRI